MLLCSKLFIIFGSQSNNVLVGSDKNKKYFALDAKSFGIDAALQQTVLLSMDPHPIQCLGEVTWMLI